eukprot:5033708-Pyramimonas_sp.AAC.1
MWHRREPLPTSARRQPSLRVQLSAAGSVLLADSAEWIPDSRRCHPMASTPPRSREAPRAMPARTRPSDIWGCADHWRGVEAATFGRSTVAG